MGWILSFMSEGRAQSWRDQQLEHHATAGAWPWATLADFWTAFDSEFTPVAEVQEAIVKLEGRAYFQKSGESVDTYIDWFRALVKKARLQDKPSIVLKFRRGLSESLSETLANSSDPPSGTDVEQWYTRARELERNRIVQKTITGGAKSYGNVRPNFAVGMRPRGEYVPASTMTPRSVSTPAPAPATFSRSAAQPLVAMDVDAARSQGRKPLPSDVCRRCKQTGHWASTCPNRYDIRAMSVEELENELALAKDRAALEGEQQGDSAEEGDEDFGTTSG